MTVVAVDNGKQCIVGRIQIVLEGMRGVLYFWSIECKTERTGRKVINGVAPTHYDSYQC